MPLDEKASRRPEFVEGVPIILADGQPWHLRKPLVRFVPSDTSESGFTLCLTLAGDDGFTALAAKRDAVFAEGDATIGDIAGIELALGRALLRANYDLSATQVASLIQFSYDREADPDGWGIRDQVMDVVMGRSDPKARTGSATDPPDDGTDAAPTHSAE